MCLVEEESVFSVLYNPLQALRQVLAGDGAAGHDPPLVRSNIVQSKSLVRPSQRSLRNRYRCFEVHEPVESLVPPSPLAHRSCS